jgi:hypothetical protein
LAFFSINKKLLPINVYNHDKINQKTIFIAFFFKVFI